MERNNYENLKLKLSGLAINLASFFVGLKIDSLAIK